MEASIDANPWTMDLRIPRATWHRRSIIQHTYRKKRPILCLPALRAITGTQLKLSAVPAPVAFGGTCQHDTLVPRHTGPCNATANDVAFLPP